MLDLSERQVRRLATRLGGKKRGRVWRFDPDGDCRAYRGEISMSDVYRRDRFRAHTSPWGSSRMVGYHRPQNGQHYVIGTSRSSAQGMRPSTDSPVGKSHRLILGSEASADHRKLALPIFPGSLHDPLCGPELIPDFLAAALIDAPSRLAASTAITISTGCVVTPDAISSSATSASISVMCADPATSVPGRVVPVQKCAPARLVPSVS